MEKMKEMKNQKLETQTNRNGIDLTIPKYLLRDVETPNIIEKMEDHHILMRMSEYEKRENKEYFESILIKMATEESKKDS